jgi:hypothetical protein
MRVMMAASIAISMTPMPASADLTWLPVPTMELGHSYARTICPDDYYAIKEAAQGYVLDERQWSFWSKTSSNWIINSLARAWFEFRAVSDDIRVMLAWVLLSADSLSYWVQASFIMKKMEDEPGRPIEAAALEDLANIFQALEASVNLLECLDVDEETIVAAAKEMAEMSFIDLNKKEQDIVLAYRQMTCSRWIVAARSLVATYNETKSPRELHKRLMSTLKREYVHCSKEALQ